MAVRKNYDKDTKQIMTFKEPAEVKGTSFPACNLDDPGKKDLQWLYLPAFDRVSLK